MSFIYLCVKFLRQGHYGCSGLHQRLHADGFSNTYYNAETMHLSEDTSGLENRKDCSTVRSAAALASGSQQGKCGGKSMFVRDRVGQGGTGWDTRLSETLICLERHHRLPRLKVWITEERVSFERRGWMGGQGIKIPLNAS